MKKKILYSTFIALILLTGCANTKTSDVKKSGSDDVEATKQNIEPETFAYSDKIEPYISGLMPNWAAAYVDKADEVRPEEEWFEGDRFVFVGDISKNAADCNYILNFVPQSVLDEATTEDLMLALSSAMSSVLFNDSQAYFHYLDNATNIFRELLVRDDLAETIYKMYVAEDYFDEGGSSALEVILSTDLVFEGLDEEQRQNVVVLANERAKENEALGEEDGYHHPNYFLEAVLRSDFTEAAGWMEYMYSE